MSKLRIDMPDPVHKCECRVLYGDTDSGGVVYYGNYLRYFEMGRTEFMRDMGLSYKNLEKDGYILPVVESYSRYKSSAFYDDEIIIHTSLVELKKISCRFNYKIYRKSDEKMLVKGFTVHAVVNQSGKLQKMPENLFDLLNKCTV